MNMACFVRFSTVPATTDSTRFASAFVSTRRPQLLPRACNRSARLRTAMSAASVSELLASDDLLERIRGINRIDELASTSDRVHALISISTADANQQVRYAAVSRLSGVDRTSLSQEDRDNILTAARFVLVNDTESSCQSAAADVIAALRLYDGFDDLVHTFQRTSDWMLKFSIAAGLGEMGDPKAFDFLVSILDSEKSNESLLITAAIGSIGELGDARGLPIVERYLEHEDSSVRERAKIAQHMLLKARAEQ